MAPTCDRAGGRMSFHGASAFVTGGTGFIGGRLVEVLTSQYGMKVRVLVRNNNSGVGSYRAAGCGAELVVGDITDEAAMTAATKESDYVFHCAFGASGDADQDRHVTVDGTATLARAAAANGIRHFVNLSTIVVFGKTPPVVDENYSPSEMWRWPYAHQKLAAERAVSEVGARSGMPVTTLRLGTIYGPWAPAFTLYPIASLTSGKVVLIDNGEGVSNAAYIDDVIQAMILSALRKGAEHETLIIRGPDRVTWRQFYDAYEDMLGTDSLVSMTARQIRAHAQRTRAMAIRQALPAAVRALRNDPAFKAIAGKLPLVRPVWGMHQKVFQTNSENSASVAFPAKHVESSSIFVLPKMMWGYYASQTDYRIDRARNIIGYEPVFDLVKGMTMTKEWANWAGLISRR